MTYLLAFALSTCVLVHTGLYHGQSLINGMKRIRVEPDDIHAKLMRNYPEVPEWWYVSAFCVFFSVAIIAVEVGVDFFGGRYIANLFFIDLAYGGAGLGTVALCTSSSDLYTTIWIHLCDDGTRCT